MLRRRRKGRNVLASRRPPPLLHVRRRKARRRIRRRRIAARREHVEDWKRAARAPARAARVRAVHHRRRRQREPRRCLQRRHDRTLVLRRAHAVLQNHRVQRQSDRCIATWRNGPVQRPHQQVARHAAAIAVRCDVAGADVAHALRAHRNRALDRERIAHRQHALGMWRIGYSRHQREARSRVRERGCPRRPLHAAHELARRAILGFERLNLAHAAVDAQRNVRVPERLAVRSALRQRLELERHRTIVTADILRVLLAKELAAVADEEGLEEVVEAVERLPDLLIDLHAHRELAAALAENVRQREAVIGCLDGLDGQRSALGPQEAERCRAFARSTRKVHRIDPSKLIVIRRILDRDYTLPLGRHGLDVASYPRHLVVI